MGLGTHPHNLFNINLGHHKNCFLYISSLLNKYLGIVAKKLVVLAQASSHRGVKILRRTWSWFLWKVVWVFVYCVSQIVIWYIRILGLWVCEQVLWEVFLVYLCLWDLWELMKIILETYLVWWEWYLFDNGFWLPLLVDVDMELAEHIKYYYLLDFFFFFTTNCI